MNSGRANSSCVVRMFQAYCGSSLSSGIERNIASSKVAVSARVKPIQRPPASSANRMANRLTTSMLMKLAFQRQERRRWPSLCAWSFDGRSLHAMIFERQPERRLDGARQELQRQQQHPEGDDGLRKPQRRVARRRQLPAREGCKGEL